MTVLAAVRETSEDSDGAEVVSGASMPELRHFTAELRPLASLSGVGSTDAHRSASGTLTAAQSVNSRHICLV